MNPKRLGALSAALAFAFFLLWLFWSFYGVAIGNWFLGSSDPIKAGPWGDSFGAFNALISSLGFCAVVMTLWSQSKSLQQQQNAIEMQKQQLDRQQRDLHLQRFESTFFDLLRLLRECRDQFKFGDRNGVAAFASLSDRIMQAPLYTSSNLSNVYSVDYETNLHPLIEIEISPYFRVIYRILDRIRSDSILSDSEKIEFSKLLRGQLSSAELTAIGVNATLKLSNDLGKLLAEFHMLKYLPKNSAAFDELNRLISPKAFQKRGD